MRRDLSLEAIVLADYMSELSEEAFLAGWMQDLELDLWRAVVQGPREHGRLQITVEHIARLRELSASAAGWIVFDDEQEEMWHPLPEWEARYEQWKPK